MLALQPCPLLTGSRASRHRVRFRLLLLHLVGGRRALLWARQGRRPWGLLVRGLRHNDEDAGLEKVRGRQFCLLRPPPGFHGRQASDPRRFSCMWMRAPHPRDEFRSKASKVSQHRFCTLRSALHLASELFLHSSVDRTGIRHN